MAYTVSESMKSISDYIDSMAIYENDYPIICNLLENMDDSLFLKVMEEMKDGNLTFSDFKRVLSGDSMGDLMAESFESQEKLYEKYVDLLGYLKDLKVVSDGDRLGYLAGMPDDLTIGSSGSSLETIDRENAVSSLISRDPSEDPLAEFYGNAVLADLLDSAKSPKAIDALLLSAHEYLIPVDYDSITITESDRRFMTENSVSEGEMRKIKSLAAFNAVRYNDLIKKNK